MEIIEDELNAFLNLDDTDVKTEDFRGEIRHVSNVSDEVENRNEPIENRCPNADPTNEREVRNWRMLTDDIINGVIKKSDQTRKTDD